MALIDDLAAFRARVLAARAENEAIDRQMAAYRPQAYTYWLAHNNDDDKRDNALFRYAHAIVHWHSVDRDY